MTHEELIAKAIEHARQCGIPVEKLQQPNVREAAVVRFRSSNSQSSTAEFYLDRASGELITATFSGGELTPRKTGKSFSKGAQELLALASQESRSLDCEHVGSEHLLLGVLAYGNGVGFAILSAAGLTLEELRGYIASVGSTPEEASAGYGPSMRSVLRAACRHADSLGHAEVEPEHLVLGLLEEVDGGAKRSFAHFGIDTEQTKRALLQRISEERK